ncbi:MAG: preprotein translocase subunit SecG [Puniceicoccaceae bacterium]
MATFLIALFSVVLVLVCLFVTLLVLMQKPSSNSGMGAALGGGAAEQAFGGEAGNVLTRGTIYAIIAFFVLSFGLYLGTLSSFGGAGGGDDGPSITNLEGDQPMSGGAPAGGEEADAPGEEEEADAPGEAGEAESPADADSVPSDEDSSPLQLEDLDAPQPSGGS